MVKCLSKDRNGDQCRNNGLGETRFCKFHQYMNEYTDEMLSHLELCKGCKKQYYFEDGEKTCTKCLNRGKENKMKEKEAVVLCEKEGCKFTPLRTKGAQSASPCSLITALPSGVGVLNVQRCKKSDENKYCGKHQLCIFEDETREAGKKLCFNYIRGCRAQLDMSYAYSRCEECLEKDRKKDKERRTKAVTNDMTPPITNNLTMENFNLENILQTNKVCTNCLKEHPINHFNGVKNNITKTCKGCREEFKKNDLKRDKEHRNAVARKNEAKPERKAVKAKWEEENYDKVAKKWMDYRERQMEKLGMDEYLKKGAETAKKWRENNPEKTAQVNENKKNRKDLQYNVYKRNAGIKNLEFTLSYADFENIVKKECNYCGIIQEKGFNGIDRKDQTVGYVLNNCVSCCKLCNYMKGSTNDEVFIKRVEHILTVQKRISGNLYPECFADHKGAYYNEYRNRALKKQLDFVITEEDFERITKNNCFMCDKKSDETHRNGIDRMDSEKGYIFENINACCCECNYIKKDYKFDDIISKFILIYEKHKDDFLDGQNKCIELKNTFTNNNDKILTNILRPSNIINYQYEEKLESDKEIDIMPIKEVKLENKLTENNKHLVVNKNKKTKEEIREANKLYKQKQREKLKERYGDEEYKKLRAKEIATYRLEKNA